MTSNLDAEQKALEIAKEFGIDLESMKEHMKDIEWIKEKVLKLCMAYVQTCYVIGNSYYESDKSFDKEQICHLQGKRNVIKGLLIMLAGNDPAVQKLLGI